MPLPHEIAEGRRFDAFAEGYDGVACAVRERVLAAAVASARERGPEFVVDVGCGTGRALIELSPAIDRGVGLDVSGKMLEVARRNAAARGCGNLQFSGGSFLEFGIPPQEGGGEKAVPDVVMATYAMHHLSTDEKRTAIESLSAVLRPGGALVIGDLMFFEDPAEFESEFAAVGYGPEHDRPETIESLVGLLEEVGLRVEVQRVHALAGVVTGRK